MNVSSEELLNIVGAKEVELYVLRKKVVELEALLERARAQLEERRAA